MAYSYLAIFDRIPLGEVAAQLIARRGLPLRHRLLCYSTIFVILGASALFHSNASYTLAFWGFLAWVTGVALLLLAFTVDRFPPAARLAAHLSSASFLFVLGRREPVQVVDDAAMAYRPPSDELELALEVVGGRAGAPLPALHHLQHRLLDAGRILVLGGCLVVTYSFGDPDANTGHVLTGFVLVLLGVSHLMLSLAVNQLPGAARVGAGVANVVLNYFFVPEN